MLSRLTSSVLLTLLTLLTLVEANYYPIAPDAATVWTAGKKQVVMWQDDGKSPSLAKLGKTSIQLWTGGAQSQTFLDELGTVDAAAGKMSVEVDPNLGESGQWYFLRFRGEDRSAALDSFSARFTLKGMKGTFPQAIKQQLADLDPSNLNSTTSSSSTKTKTTSSSQSPYSKPTTSSSSGLGGSPVTPVSARPSASGSSASSATRLQGCSPLVVSFVLASMATFLGTFTFFTF